RVLDRQARQERSEMIKGLAPNSRRLNLPPLMMESPSSIGRRRHLRPVIGMTETPGRLVRVGVPLGFHKPVWHKSIDDPGLPADERHIV
ncbi:MAG: hypothetical protein ACRECY_11310, partial [Phyllobacterium sp.]